MSRLDRVQVVAHRGASAIRPENTMIAFEAAKALGADAIEFDVHATRDGQLIVNHDYSLDRTTSGSGLVHERGWDYVRALDAGSWFAPDFAGERIPLLATVLRLGGVEFELQLNGCGRQFLGDVVQSVVAADALQRTEFTSWNVGMLITLKTEYPGARIGMFSQRRESWMSQELFEWLILGSVDFIPADVVHVYAADIGPALVDRLHAAGRTVHANDAASEAEVTRAVDAGADRLSTNDVALALAAVGK